MANVKSEDAYFPGMMPSFSAAPISVAVVSNKKGFVIPQKTVCVIDNINFALIATLCRFPSDTRIRKNANQKTFKIVDKRVDISRVRCYILQIYLWARPKGARHRLS